MQGLEALLPFVLILAVFWFLVLRPARNQQKRLRETQARVAVGAEVMLGSGIYGTVTEVGEDTLRLQIAPGTVVTVARQAVVRVVEPAPATDAPAADAADAPERPADSSDPQ